MTRLSNKIYKQNASQPLFDSKLKESSKTDCWIAASVFETIVYLF